MSQAITAQVYVGYTARTVDPGSVSGASTLDVSVTWNKALPGHFFDVKIPTLASGLGIVGAWCDTAGTVKVRLMNATASPIDDTAKTWYFLIR